MVDPERTSPVDSPLALTGARCVLIRIGSPLSLASVRSVSASGRSGLFCAGSCSALVPVVVATGRDAEERDRQQHREGGLDLDHGLNLSGGRFAVKLTCPPRAASGSGVRRGAPPKSREPGG